MRGYGQSWDPRTLEIGVSDSSVEKVFRVDVLSGPDAEPKVVVKCSDWK